MVIESLKKKQIVLLFGVWTTFVLILIAGFLLLDIFKEAAIDYLGYYLLLIGITITLYLLLTRAIIQGKKIKMLIRIPLVLWIVIILGGGIVGIGFSALKINARSFQTTPYLSWIDGQNPSNSITVSWITATPEKTELAYGLTRSNLDKNVENTTLTRFHHVFLNELLANSTYYYQVTGFSVKQFTTAPLGIFNYSFCVWSDHRTNTDIMASFTQPNIVPLISAQMKSAGITPAFSLFCGDLTSQANDNMSWDTWFKDISSSDWAANQTVQNAYGNHERYGDTNAQTVQNFYPYPQQADGRFYYSFDYGNCHFIFLDPYSTGHSWASNFTVEQLAWLENDLATHTSANFTIISMHPPPQHLSEVKIDLGRLIKQYDIDLIFAGHEHTFERFNMNGSEVLTIGLGGNPNNDYRNFECDTAFARIDVSAQKLRVVAQFTNGTTLTDFDIPI